MCFASLNGNASKSQLCVVKISVTLLLFSKKLWCEPHRKLKLDGESLKNVIK